VDQSIQPGDGGWGFSVEVSAFREVLPQTSPVAVYRNRERSLADSRWTTDIGIYRHGDAAFADFLVQATITRQF
jgi:hypothetical protein